MSLPIVAVVGRPNVGKSTFVNRITGNEDAIVHDVAGTTRDRTYHKADWNGVEFMLVDTGGIEMGDDDRFQKSIREQALIAADEADAIIFLVDGRNDITEEDEQVARLLKRCDAPVFLAVNKMDNPDDESAIWNFMALGLGEPRPISAVHGHGTGDLLDEIVAVLPENVEDDDDEIVKVAIIGRPNAGKSSLLNRMLGEERAIVSPIAGTTRDSIDTMVEHDGRTYRLVDTAGISKKSGIVEDIEYYSYLRSLRAIERSDVAILVIDGSLGLTDQDQKVADIARERGVGMLICINKWDVVDTKERRDEILEDIGDRMIFVGYAPVQPISALTGRSINRIWPMIDAVADAHARRIPTSKLNVFLTEIRDFGYTLYDGRKRLKINYVTQTGTCPPVFTFFANHPEMVDDNYARFLENRMREKFDLVGTPIRLVFKRKAD